MARTLQEVAAVLEARSTVNDEGCLIYGGSRTTGGYARIKFGGRNHEGHRVMYQAHVGEIPDGLVLDHVCHNRAGCLLAAACPHRACVNPEHLEPVTRRENKRRAPLSHRPTCKYGHALDEKNTYRYKGTRFCRKCGVDRSREYRQRQMLRAANVPPLRDAA